MARRVDTDCLRLNDYKYYHINHFRDHKNYRISFSSKHVKKVRNHSLKLT